MNPLLNPVFFGRIAYSYLFDTNRVRRLSEDQLRKYQDTAVRKVVQHAFTVPLYHSKYREKGIHPRDIRGVRDIEKLPYMTKKDFREASPEELLPKGVDPSRYTRVSTSGSSGKPVTLYSDPFTVFKTLIGFIRSIREHDISWFRSRMAIIADLSPDSAEDAYFAQMAVPNLKSFFSFKNLRVVDVNEKPEKLIEELASFNPEFLGGYPGVLKILAILKERGKGNGLNPRVIATSGAIVDDYTKACIRRAFDTDLFDAYGATECSPIAFQCKSGHYHLNTDFAYVEFMDFKKKEKISGDGGNIIVTRLFGQGTPVIRYTGLSDFVVPSDAKSDCGIHTPVIDRIEGRQVDAIVLPNGEIIPPSSFTGIPYKVMHKLKTNKIQQFQIIQHSTQEIDILIVIEESTRNIGPSVKEIFAEIQQLYEKKIGHGVTINVKEVDKIKTVRAGSATPPPVVISKVDAQQVCR